MIKGARCRRWVAWGNGLFRVVLAGCLALGLAGCATFSEWIHNGFEVGPNYSPPDAPVPGKWIDDTNPRVRLGNPNIASWWDAFGDPVLSRLIHEAAAQNLTVRQAGIQILQAQIQRNIARSELLPQSQSLLASGAHGELSTTGFAPGGGPTAGMELSPSTRVGSLAAPTTPIAAAATALPVAGTTATLTSPFVNDVAGAGGVFGEPTGNSRFFNNLGTSLNLGWELDFWGLFRRNLEAANASLDQSMHNYDEIMVQLLANVATQYITVRTLQKRLELARQNVRLQEPLVDRLQQQFKFGIANSKPAYYQLKSNLDNTRALIPPLEIALRQANNQLCVLLGKPVHDLIPELGDGFVPDPKDPHKLEVRIPRSADDTVVVGIPGDLLLKRPDVKAMERQLRIQSAQIGIAEAEMFPHVGINGTIGLASNRLGTLFNQQSLVGSIGPSLTWNILDYGRLLANVRSQNYQFQQYVLAYQQTLLNANQDAENSLVAYVQSLEQSKRLDDSAEAAVEVTRHYYTQLAQGYVPGAGTSLEFYNQIFTAVNFQVQQQDSAAQAEGNIALNLILVYRALGGGWQVRLEGAPCQGPPTPPPAPPAQTLPSPMPLPVPTQMPRAVRLPDPSTAPEVGTTWTRQNSP